MAEEKEKIVLIATHAGEDPERASFPLMLANASMAGRSQGLRPGPLGPGRLRLLKFIQD